MEKMTNEYLDNLEKDLNLIIRDNFHPKHLDLMNICINEEVMELIKFTRKVLKVFNYKDIPIDGSFEKGFNSGIKQIKREIFDEENS